MKKIKLFALAVMAMLSTNAFAADADITATVTVSTGGTKYSPVVDGKSPLTYEIKKVMDNNGNGEFKSGEVCVYENGTEMKTLTSITIPATVVIPIKIGTTESTQTFKVTAIGDGTNQAFTAANSNALATLTIGSNVATINKDAFKDVATLATVTFGGAETEIGESAFEGTIISALTLPSTLVTIGKKAFAASATKYPSFSTVAIPATVTTIGESAFEGCENLATVTVAASSQLFTIGIGAFAYTSLTELDLSSATEYNPTPATPATKTGMTAFGTADASYGPFTSAAHAATSLITTVVLPTTCATIEKSALKGVQYLSEIGLTNVKTIAQDAFSGCKNLTAVAIGTAIADDATGFNGIAIGKDAFEGCVKLATVEVGKIAAGVIEDDAFGTTTLAAVKTFKFNTIAAALGDDAWDLPTVTTLYFQKYIATANIVPTNAFADAAFDDAATETDYHIYYNVTLPTGVAAAALAFKDDAFGAAADARIITLHTSKAVQTAYAAENAINKVTISGDFSGSFTIGKGEEGSKVLVKDKNSSNYYYYYSATAITTIAKEQESGANVTVYQAYTDGDGDEVDIYFMPLQVVDGVYGVEANQIVVIKSDKEDAVEAAPGVAADVTMVKNYSGTVLNELRITAAAKSKLAVMSDGTLLANGTKEVWFFNNPASSGFGFTKYDSSKQNGLAANCVYLQTDPSAASRVNIIWLDEQGNTTAIQTIEKSADNGAIYNLAGQKVSNSYKGFVIKNGKKYIQK